MIMIMIMPRMLVKLQCKFTKPPAPAISFSRVTDSSLEEEDATWGVGDGGLADR
jgi:hypothetical protein